MEWQIEDRDYLIRMDDGEDLIENIKFIKDKILNMPSVAILSGLGMLRNVKIGYFNGNGYEIHFFEEPVEVTCISGSISAHGEPFFHIHLTFSLKDGRTFGGHLISAYVANTLEFFLTGMSFKIRRKQAGSLRVIEF